MNRPTAQAKKIRKRRGRELSPSPQGKRKRPKEKRKSRKPTMKIKETMLPALLSYKHHHQTKRKVKPRTKEDLVMIIRTVAMRHSWSRSRRLTTIRKPSTAM